MHCCPYCERTFVVNSFEKWWETIECGMRKGLIAREREKIRQGFMVSEDPPDGKVNDMLCDQNVLDSGPLERIKLFACPACVDLIVGKDVLPRYIGLHKRWLHEAAKIDTGGALGENDI
jgi:hypothetical protein